MMAMTTSSSINVKAAFEPGPRDCNDFMMGRGTLSKPAKPMARRASLNFPSHKPKDQNQAGAHQRPGGAGGTAMVAEPETTGCARCGAM